MGNRRHTFADGKNERRRSVRLADADARAPRQQVADLPDRKPHAVELQSLNGHSLALSQLCRQGEDQRIGFGKGRRKLCNGLRHRRHPSRVAANLPNLSAALIQFAAGRQPTDSGRFTATGRTFVQSSPSISASNCAWFSRTRVGAIFGQQNFVSSSVLANRHVPLPSHQTALTRSALFERNTYSAPLNGSAPPSRTSAIKPVAPLRKSTGVLAS